MRKSHGWNRPYQETAISHVIFAFCATIVAQNAKIAWEISYVAYVCAAPSCICCLTCFCVVFRSHKVPTLVTRNSISAVNVISVTLPLLTRSDCRSPMIAIGEPSQSSSSSWMPIHHGGIQASLPSLLLRTTFPCYSHNLNYDSRKDKN